MKQVDESVLATYPIAFKINEALKVRESLDAEESELGIKRDYEKAIKTCVAESVAASDDLAGKAGNNASRVAFASLYGIEIAAIIYLMDRIDMMESALIQAEDGGKTK